MHAKITKFTAEDYKVMPWKNGGGSTTELAIFPDEGNLHEPFTWRISIAQLTGSGPFSAFPGYDRVIIQLTGSPMRISHKEGGSRELQLLRPYRFRGEWTTQADLTSAAQDFNVMVRRDSASAEAECVTLHAGAIIERRSSEIAFLYVWSGSASLEMMGKAATTFREGESILIEGTRGQTLALKGNSAQVIMVSIQYKDA